MTTTTLSAAIETLRDAGFDVDGSGCVTSRERGKWGVVQLETCTVADEERIHANKTRGKPSGRFMSSIRETLGGLYG